VARFLGIPYAEPPIGELRFRKPVPARPWYPRTLDVLEFASPCSQANGSIPPAAPWLVEKERPREDCLYLNIWAPTKRTNNLGVLAWFHGGGFRTGTASTPLYDSKKLAAIGNIVVVTMNFRLGFLGFLYTGPGTSTGNYLLWDQHLCLRWIRDNIARFGGDPGRVTVYGESTGSIGMASLLMSQKNTGLFHRAIMASGSNYWLLPPQNKVGNAFADRVAKAVGCLTSSRPSSTSHPAEVVNCLRSVPVEALMRAEDTEFLDQFLPFSPAYGDDFLPVPDVTALNKGLIIPVESLMAGLMAHEGSLFIYLKDPALFGSQTAPRFTRTQASQLVGEHYLNFLPSTIQMMVNGAYQRQVTGGTDWTGTLRSPELPDGNDYPVFTKEQPMHVVLNARNTSFGFAFHEEGCKVYRSVIQMLGVATP
ncbi:unnamed protein product, partial [Ixodes hexagonus]